MTRLIDADKLTYKNIAEVNGILTHVLTAEEIDNAPTVFSCNACKYMGNEQECVNCHDYSNYVHYDARPQGTWKRYMTGYQGNKVLNITFKCSECGRKIVYVNDVDKDVTKFLAKYPFCHCGADMRGGEYEQE